MFALIQNDEVIQIEVEPFEVHSSLKWIECDSKVNVGCTFKNNVFSTSENSQIETKDTRLGA